MSEDAVVLVLDGMPKFSLAPILFRGYVDGMLFEDLDDLAFSNFLRGRTRDCGNLVVSQKFLLWENARLRFATSRRIRFCPIFGV